MLFRSRNLPFALRPALPPTMCVVKFLPVVVSAMRAMAMVHVPLTVNAIVTKGGLIPLVANSVHFRVRTWVLIVVTRVCVNLLAANSSAFVSLGIMARNVI